MPLVKDEGTGHERIVLIGEAPGATEEAVGRPFVGAAGFKIQEWQRAAGLQRSDLYWTNVVARRPPGNKIETVPRAELAEWVDQLHDRLAALEDPWVLVPTGNVALRALTDKHGILKHRGSIYEYTDRRGRRIKTIPTVHPAAVFRTPGWERRCRRDWDRISQDAAFRETRLPQREHLARPTVADLEAFVADAARADALAIDIETSSGAITCVGFAYDPSFSFTVPTTERYWGGELPRVWALVRQLCASPAAKVLQNGHYDAFWLADHDITLANWQWDTRALHHAIDATDSHSLAYMASVDTRQPFWKDMRDPKEDDEWVPWAGTDETLWHYNGIDACVTLELASLYTAKLAADGRLDFYRRHYQALFEPILSMMLRGLRVDQAQRQRQYAKLLHRCIGLQERLTELCGTPLHTTARNKKREAAGKLPDLSAKKVQAYLYETLRLPRQRDRATKNVTAKETVVRQLMLRHKDKVLPSATTQRDQLAQLVGVPMTFEAVGTAILEHRRAHKLMEFLDEGVLDEDGRLRCTFKFTTETGRFASSKSPTGRGRNLQNIDRELRGTFVPEAGCVFLEADLSQAEDRIVKMLAAAVTGNGALRERARALPERNDEHRRAATVVFRSKEITPSQRYIGKRVRHATNYDMHGRKLSEELLKDGFTMTAEECERAIESLHQADPDIREWQKDVRRQVMTHRCLVNSWGRMLSFDYERLEDDTYRRAYAFVPQSEVPALVNAYGIVPLCGWLAETGHKSVLHLQGHDSLLLSCPPGEVWDVMVFLRGALERPRRIGGEPLTIPVEFKLGRTWSPSVEYKQFPERDAVETALRTLV